MKHVLVHAYTQVNLGDDLFLRILLDRYPRTHFTLLQKGANPLYEHFGDYSIPRITFFERIVRKLISFLSMQKANAYVEKVTDRKIKLRYHAYLILGGSMFMQHDSSVGPVERFYRYFVDTIKYTYIIGANFGPFTKPDFLQFFTDMFSHCKSIIFRDTYSANLFSSNPIVSSCPDIVFQWEPTKTKRIPDSVGISVIDLKHRDTLKHSDASYLSFLIELIQQLLHNSKQVFLYSFCEAEGDSQTILRILQKIKHPNLHSVEYTGDIDSFMKSFGAMETIFASRFHAMILGLVHEQKVVPLVYSRKMTQVLDDIHFTGKVLHVDNLDTKDARSCIDSLQNYQYTLPKHIRLDSQKMFRDLDQFLAN